MTERSLNSFLDHCEQGNLQGVKDLLKNNLDINKSTERGTPLIVAARNGQTECVRFLLENGAVVNLADETGFTPILAAVERHHLDSIQILLESGADVHLEDKNGDTAVHTAAMGENVSVMRLLLDYGGDLNRADKNGNTACHLGCYDPEMLILMLERGASVNLTNEDGMTPLFLVNGDVESIQFLVQAGANVDHADKDGMTPLKRAIAHGYSDPLVELVAMGARAFEPTYWGTNPYRERNSSGKLGLHRAIELRRPTSELLSLLELYPQAACVRDINGKTPLDLAMEFEVEEVVKDLLKQYQKMHGSNCILQ